MKVKRYSIDLSQQMAVCDANYIRILKLFSSNLPGTKQGHESFEQGFKKVVELPSIASPSLQKKSQSPIQNQVWLEVVEQFKYTTSVEITQNQSGSKKPYESPKMLVRLYHDASTAEVVSYQGHRHFKSSYPLLNKNMYHADEKEQLNLFLAQWLQLCLLDGLIPEKDLSEEFLACLDYQ